MKIPKPTPIFAGETVAVALGANQFALARVTKSKRDGTVQRVRGADGEYDVRPSNVRSIKWSADLQAKATRLMAAAPNVIYATPDALRKAILAVPDQESGA